jgi:hypothetical protein
MSRIRAGYLRIIIFRFPASGPLTCGGEESKYYEWVS